MWACTFKWVPVDSQSFPLCWLEWTRINGTKHKRLLSHILRRPSRPSPLGLDRVLKVQISALTCFSKKRASCHDTESMQATQWELALALSQGQGSHQGYGSRREVTWPPHWKLMVDGTGSQVSRWTNILHSIFRTTRGSFLGMLSSPGTELQLMLFRVCPFLSHSKGSQRVCD